LNQSLIIPTELKSTKQSIKTDSQNSCINLTRETTLLKLTQAKAVHNCINQTRPKLQSIGSKQKQGNRSMSQNL